ncbi:VOC family protein [Trinickia terrae]|uniref:VOC family protein n=1 Tax=Trinickia terrae TaxID=2571161 RepID=A0A4U1IC98_9BURK|nr:VOC family protein [Trinickia terrae]TKC91045.1 VOC family protein [Trinickia terrae]
MTAATLASTRVLSWFEIPALDFERAVRFYETALDMPLKREIFGGVPIAVFAHDEGATGGAIVFDPQQAKPAAGGVLVYLDASPSVSDALARVERAGGKKHGPAIELPNSIGYIAFFTDSEGNRIGLHSPKLA